MMKKYLILLKNIPNSRLECTNHTLFQTKMVEIDTPFQTKTAKKNIPFGAAHTYIAYIRVKFIYFYHTFLDNSVLVLDNNNIIIIIVFYKQKL